MDLVRIMKIAMTFYSGENTFWFLLIPGIIYLVLLVMGGFGMYTMASRRGVKYKWRVFIPFANGYMLGILAGDRCTFFGTKVRRIKLWVLMSEVLAAVVGSFSVFAVILLCSPMFSEVRQAVDGVFYFDGDSMTSAQKVFYNAYQISNWAYYFFELLYIVFFITAILNVFRRYVPAQSFVYTLISAILPVENIFLFAVCRNKEVNYNDYIRARYARYRSQNGYYNPPPPRGNSPYGGNRSGYNYDPYTGKPLHHDENKKDEDPFPEFNGDKKDGNGSSGGSSGSSDDSNPFDL